MKWRPIVAGLIAWGTFAAINGAVAAVLLSPVRPPPLRTTGIGLITGSAIGLALYLLIFAIRRRPP